MSGRRSQSQSDENDAELQAALRASLNEVGQQTPHESQTSNNFPGNQETHLTSEQIRQRRLRRFQQ